MPDFGPNGAVVAESTRDYAVADEKPKIRRVALACFLCSLAASIAVALIAALAAFLFTSIAAAIGAPPSQFGQQDGFMAGAFIAVMMAAFNWYLFYIVVPVTWLVLSFSIGRFPRRAIARPGPYYRWGAIWGAVLVGGTTGFFGLAMEAGSGLGALVTGAAIGAAAGRPTGGTSP